MVNNVVRKILKKTVSKTTKVKKYDEGKEFVKKPVHEALESKWEESKEHKGKNKKNYKKQKY